MSCRQSVRGKSEREKSHERTTARAQLLPGARPVVVSVPLGGVKNGERDGTYHRQLRCRPCGVRFARGAKREEITRGRVARGASAEPGRNERGADLTSSRWW